MEKEQTFLPYKILLKGGEGEIVEKKSRFIATLFPVHSEEEAAAFIESMKKKYWDARHNCSAFVLGERAQVTRCSDDGEPSGTAGRPILDVLVGSGLYDAVIVVTRYFGGVLLGTGGLVRAYSSAAREGLAQSVIIEKQEGAIYQIGTDYQGLGKIQYQAGEQNIPIMQADYGENVKLELVLTQEQEGHFFQGITEATGGKAQIQKIRDVNFAVVDGQVELFG